MIRDIRTRKRLPYSRARNAPRDPCVSPKKGETRWRNRIPPVSDYHGSSGKISINTMYANSIAESKQAMRNAIHLAPLSTAVKIIFIICVLLKG